MFHIFLHTVAVEQNNVEMRRDSFTCFEVLTRVHVRFKVCPEVTPHYAVKLCGVVFTYIASYTLSHSR